MSGLLIVSAALCIHNLIHVAILTTLFVTGPGVSQVDFGIPGLLRFSWRGVSFRLGPLPLFSRVLRRSTEAQVQMKRDHVWVDPEARRLAEAQELEAASVPLKYRAGGPLTSMLVFGLGWVLCGERHFPPLGTFLVTFSTQLWLPWTRGAVALRQGFAELAALPLGPAIGSVLIRWTILNLIFAALGWPLLHLKGGPLATVLTLLLAVFGMGWLLALPFALF